MSTSQDERLIALDMLPIIRAFREAGGTSFQHLSVERARSNYEASCASNGLSADTTYRVTNVMLDSTPPIQVRVYQPSEPAPGTLGAGVLYLHGGGWVLGSLDTHDSICRYLAFASNATVVAVDYRLAPEHPYPAAIEDCRWVMSWLFKHASDFNIDSKRIAVAGDSAGGQMAAVLAQENAEWLAAQVLLYPVTDATMSCPSYSRVESGFPLTGDTMRWFVDHYAPHAEVRLAADISPLLQASIRRGPQALIVTVEHDPLCDEGVRYASKLAEAGTAVEQHHLAGYSHGLLTSAGIVPRGAKVLERVAAFIRESTTAT